MNSVNVVYALIHNKEKNQILIVSNKGHLDSWSLPGGAVEENETLEQAIIREVQEETGINIKVKNIVSINERFFDNKSKHALFITFNAEAISGEISIKNPNEISEVKWVDIIVADKLMPYYKYGINNLLNNCASYYFQEN